MLNGLIAAPYTPMGADGSVDLNVIEQQAALLAGNGVAGAFICGTTGESLSLTVAERLQVAERWIATAPDGFKVIVHVGSASLSDSRTLAAHAQQAGAKIIGAMAPPFIKAPTVEALADFCAAVAGAASKTPFYYYHIPSMTGANFQMIDFLAAAEDRIPTLTGIKFTSEDLADFGQCLHYGGGKFNMLFGRDEMLLAGLAMGAPGGIGSTYNFAAPLYRRIIEAFKAGAIGSARAAQAKATEMVAILKAHGKGCGVMASGKAAMKLVGVDCGLTRAPLANLTDAELDALKQDLDAIGFAEFCCKA